MSAVTTEGAWDELSLTPEEYKRASARYRHRRSFKGYLFILPYFLPFLAFLVVPVFWSLWLSFNQGGLSTRRSSSDSRTGARSAATASSRSRSRTRRSTSSQRSSSSSRSRSCSRCSSTATAGQQLYKLALYVPLLAAVLVGLVWQFIANYDFGLFNLILTTLGFGRVNIFGNGTLALGTIVLAEVWRGLGFWTLYFLASLQNIPEELLDAARVDGARGFQRFRRVTIPLLRPMLLFAVVIAIIANFQVFDTVYVLTQGGPVQSTSTMVWFIWKRLFQFHHLLLKRSNSDSGGNAAI